MAEQDVNFPFDQPYEGFVAERNDPKNMGRVRVRLPGAWDPYGPWCPVIGARYGGSSKGWSGIPPEGALVLVFFVSNSISKPRVLGGSFGAGELPDGTVYTNDGDAKVFEDERIRVLVDSRPATTALRVTDLATGGTALDVDLDIASGQVGISTTLGILLKTTGAFRVDAGSIQLGDRLVLKRGKPL
jgi:hypothetical protein